MEEALSGRGSQKDFALLFLKSHIQPCSCLESAGDLGSYFWAQGSSSIVLKGGSWQQAPPTDRTVYADVG